MSIGSSRPYNIVSNCFLDKFSIGSAKLKFNNLAMALNCWKVQFSRNSPTGTIPPLLIDFLRSGIM